MAERLTERQLQCLRLSATMTDKEIARALGISENTVDKHFREGRPSWEVLQVSLSWSEKPRCAAIKTRSSGDLSGPHSPLLA